MNLQPVLQRDDDLLDITLRRIAGEINLTPVEGTLSIAGLEVSGTPGRMGRSVDMEATHNVLATAVRRGLGGSVDLVVQEHRPAVMDVEAAVTKARAVLGHSFGGNVALEYALRYPGHLSHLILMDTGADTYWVQHNAAQVLAKRGYSPAAVQAVHRFYSGKLTPAERAAYARWLERHDQRRNRRHDGTGDGPGKD